MVYSSINVLVVKCPIQTPRHIVFNSGKYFWIYAVSPFLKIAEVTLISCYSLYSYLCCNNSSRSCSVCTEDGILSPLLKQQKLYKVMGRGVDLSVANCDWKSIKMSISSSQLLHPTIILYLYCVLSFILLCFSSRKSSKLLLPRNSSLKLQSTLSVLLPMNRLIWRQFVDEQISQSGPILHPICRCSFSKRIFLFLRHCFLNLFFGQL